MTSSLEHAGELAHLLRAIEPYLDDIVLVGGWVHALYVQEADPTLVPVRTTDVDFSLPRTLLRRDRPDLLQLIKQAGYDVEPIGGEPSLVFVRKGEIDLDLLCEADDPREIIQIDGQDSLAVQGYPYIGMLLEASRPILLGEGFHESLKPPLLVRIPNLPAYTLGKSLSALNRQRPGRKAKDLVYLYQVMRERALLDQLSAELDGHVARYPEASRAAAEALERLWNQRALMRDAGHQILELGLAPDSADPVIDLRGRMRRLKNELDGSLPN